MRIDLQLARSQNPEAARRLFRVPEVPEGWASFLNAYGELQTCRPLGFGGFGPIPWTAIARWADAHGLDADERQTLTRVIRALDGVFLEDQGRKEHKDAARDTPD